FHGNNVHHIGYGHPRLKRAIAEQMDALPFAPRRYACEPAIALAHKLSAISPFGPAKVLFTTGGSDAIEVAVKLARAATGRGKTGAMFACQHDGMAPDMLVLGKALGGGILPIAAVLARPGLDVGADWAFGHYTHEKNPVTARAALTTIEIIEEEALVANAA